MAPHYVYDKYQSYRFMHWACAECFVMPMCKERCNRTYFQHKLCKDCKGCLNFPCEKVQKAQRWELFLSAYGHILRDEINKRFRDTALIKM